MRLFGFPLHVGSGFWLFMGLITLIHSSFLGLGGAVLFAALIAGFTLVHELGHAFAARATGARAEISLAFMMGYASFVPTRKLTRWEQVGISFAGPATQIVIGAGLYLALGGGWPIEDLTIAQFAALWAGPMIGLFNLVPVLPFDGGNILLQGLGAVFGDRAHKMMLWFSAAVSVAGVIAVVIEPALRGFIIFVMIPLLTVASMASGKKAQTRQSRSQEQFARAEALAWATGDVSAFISGHVPSPWFRAHQHLQQGDPDVARQIILADFADADGESWWPPDAASKSDLQALVDLLPRPLPHGPLFSDFALSAILLRLGDFETAGRYAAEAYTTHRPAMLAVHVARAAAALGDRVTATQWLQEAARTAPADALRAIVVKSPEFDSMRDDPRLAEALAP